MYGQDSCKKVDHNQDLEKLMELSNFPKNMMEVANGMNDHGYEPVYGTTAIDRLDFDNFESKDRFTVSGKKGDFSFTLVGMEVLYNRDISKKKVIDDTKILVHAQDINGNYVDFIMKPTSYELVEQNKRTTPKAIPFLSIKEKNGEYKIFFNNEDLLSIFDREIAIYIEVVLTLENFWMTSTLATYLVSESFFRL